MTVGRSWRARRRGHERVLEWLLLLAALVSVAVTVAIVYVLVAESIAFFDTVPISDFVADSQWTPLFEDAHYGIGVLLSATVTCTVVALSLALPVGGVIAIYLSEFASPVTRDLAKPVLELLGAVPTIVYGYFALMFVTPLLQHLIPGLPGFNLLSAGLLLGLTTVLIFTVMMVPPRFYGTSVEAVEGRVLLVVEKMQAMMQAGEMEFSEAAFFQVRDVLREANAELRQQVYLNRVDARR